MSYKTVGNSIYLTRGDTLDITIQIYNADGSAYTPEAGDTIRFAVKRSQMTIGNKRYVDASPLIIKPISTDDFVLSLAPSDTSSLDFGQYVYDIELTKADGTVDTFITASPFILTPEVH